MWKHCGRQTQNNDVGTKRTALVYELHPAGHALGFLDVHTPGLAMARE